MVWDVSSATVIASLEDPLAAAQSPGPVARKTEPGKGGAVRGLAWIMSNPCVLHGGHKSASTTAVSWCAMAHV